MKKTLVILFCLLAAAVHSHAQLNVKLSQSSEGKGSTNIQNSSEGDIYYSSTLDDVMKRRAAEKVAQMNDYISFMGSKKKDLEVRQYYRSNALNLFLGRGQEYEENGIKKQGVRMEITSLKRNTVTHKLIRDYFTDLTRLKYTDVQISSTEIAQMKVSNLQKIADDLYVCTCQYDQAFVGYKDGKPVYNDITTKRIKCYIYVEKTEDGNEYIVKLGDVQALSTKKG